MGYPEDLHSLKDVDCKLASDLSGCRTLEHVLAWMKARGLPLGGIELVTQDEYSHDLLIPLGPGARCLVFGMT